MTDVIGLDLSLTSTGLAGRDWTDQLKPPATLTGVERIAWINTTLTDRWLNRPARGDQPPLVAIEGPSYGSTPGQRGHHERAGLWWAVRLVLWARDIPTAVVPPASLKRYATGRGNATKDEVLMAAARRFNWFDGGNDAADALWLAAMAADHLGTPIADMPATHRAALDGVAWPDTPTRATRGEDHE